MSRLQPRAIKDSIRTLNLSELADAITSVLKTINPQDPDPQNSPLNPLNQFSPHLATNLVNQVIKRQSQNPTQALYFFNWASKPNPNPQNYTHSDSSYATVLDVLLSNSLFSLAFSILEKSKKVDDFFISKFVKANGDKGNVKGAIFWFHKAKEVRNGKCLCSFNALLGVLVRANKLKLAKSLFDGMVIDGVLMPDVSTYTTMMKGCCKFGMIGDARKLFDEMPVRPNKVTFNTMINGYCKIGDMENAWRLFRQMRETDSCLPDTVTYTTLVDGYCKKGEFDEAMCCMDEMVKAGCEPNLLTYNAVIYGLCLRGRVGEAKKMMTRMRLNGVKENLATHISILKGLSFEGRSEEAVEYFKKMISSNMNPDVKCYSVVVNEYCKMKKPDEAILLLQEMRGKGMHPSVSSFNSVLRLLMEFGNSNKAISLLKQMPKMGCSPNFISYSTVMCSLCALKGKMVEAEKLVHDMRNKGFELDNVMYGSLVKGYCEDGDEMKALEIFREAIIKNYVVDVSSFSALIRKLCLENKANEAERIFEEMRRKCHVLEADSYKRAFDESFLSYHWKG